MELKYRTGLGFDIHKLVEGRDLVLGGIKIDHDKGLLGHSDADVLAHAVIDAILGALALADIGTHFPDTDEQYKNADSILLLAKTTELMYKAGYKINNLDVNIIAEAPKLRPYIDKIRDNIAKALDTDISQVSVKAKTMETLGPIGQKEGVIAQCSVLLVQTY